MSAFLSLLLYVSASSAITISREIDPLSWISSPVLAWSRGGCTPWCQTGWYSSPIFIANPDNTSNNIVVGGSYSVRAVLADSGADFWNQEFSAAKRIWAGLAYKASFIDNTDCIIAARSSAEIKVLDVYGNALIEFTEPTQSQEFRSLTIGQINPSDTAKWYIIAGQASYTDINTYVYAADLATSTLQLQSGWPQLNSNTAGGSHGIFNDNIGLADLDGDTIDDIVAPSDVINICAYNFDATPIKANARYNNKTWGEISVYVDEQYDVQGWGPCSAGDPDPFRPNHANSPVSTFKFRGETILVIPGNVDDCSTSPYTQMYYTLFVYNTDHSRVVIEADGIDWMWPPQWTGSPLSQDYTVIENIQPNVAIGDLDNDGYPEFVFSSYDGKIHCFSFKSSFQQNLSYHIAQEPYYWPYYVTPMNDESVIVFSSEPVIADLDGDYIPEVVVVTWTQKDSGVDGELLILSYAGTLLASSPLNMSVNGALTAPTIGNIDTSDDVLEITFITINGGMVMYKIPNTDINNANIDVWPTGRANFNRDGKSALEYEGTPLYPNAVLPQVTRPSTDATTLSPSTTMTIAPSSVVSGSPTTSETTPSPVSDNTSGVDDLLCVMYIVRMLLVVPPLVLL